MANQPKQHTKVSGTWKVTDRAYVRASGIWGKVVFAWQKLSGVWTRIAAYHEPVPAGAGLPAPWVPGPAVVHFVQVEMHS